MESGVEGNEKKTSDRGLVVAVKEGKAGQVLARGPALPYTYTY